MDIATLKLADLKRELRERGLSTTGAKQVLVDRLVEAMSAEKAANEDSNLDDDLLDEDSMLDDEESDGDEADDSVAADLTISSPVATVPPVSLPSPPKSTEALKRPGSSPLKTEHNGASCEAEGGPPSKKKIILNRQPVPDAAPQVLSVATAESIKAATENKPPAEGDKAVLKKLSEAEPAAAAPAVADKLKLRQQKFGSISASAVPSNVTSTAQVTEKLQKRSERFGGLGVGVAAAGKVQLTTEDELRLAKRKERFGLPSEEKLDEMKQKRAARFGAAAGNSKPQPPGANSGDADEKKRLRAARFAAVL